MQEYVKRKSILMMICKGEDWNFSWTHNDLQVAVVGPKIDLTYAYDHLGDSTSVLNELASGKHAFSKVCRKTIVFFDINDKF